MRTVKRALAVLEAFHRDNPNLSLQEIADEIGLAKSTAFRLVRTLEECGYLIRTDDKRYSLSFKFVRMAGLAQSYLDVRSLVRPSLAELAAASGESVTFHAIEDDARVCIEVVNTPSPLMSVNRPGERIPLGLGGASLVLMASLPAAQLEEILPRAARNAKCSRRELLTILDTVRRQGYAVSHGGGIPGVSGVSAPVHDAEGIPRYCVSIVIPTVRVRGKISSFTTLVRAAAADISRQFGND
ncbi:MAG TPA: IclR family transcriptional regulator [Burkholderiales bacterium]|nr:IclR family transcriptional regulator [Burkholderiales bacterium]